jgi:large subunit ribosomal protein L33
MARAGREIITLQCTECKRRNYTTTKNKKTMTEKLELKKFCRHDRKHTPPRESKEGVALILRRQRAPKDLWNKSL